MLKKLAGSVREYKKDSLLSPFFITLEVVMEVLLPFIMADLIDLGIDAGNMNQILRQGGLLLLCALTSLVFGVLSGRHAAFASAGFAHNLRQDMFRNVQRFSFANIDKFSTAGIITRLTTDVTNVQMAFMMIIRVAVRSPSMLLFSLIMAFSVNHRLALVFLAVIPVLGLGLYLIISHAHPIFRTVFKTYDRLNKVVQENLRGIRVVKSFVREEHEIDKFGDVSQKIYRDFSRAERLIAFNAPLMQVCVYGCMMLISWFGARLIVGGEMTTGELMSLFTYTMQILMSLMMLSMVFVMITISRASAERICQLLDEEPTLTDQQQPLMEVADGSISFRNVDFSYGGAEGNLCLNGINLEIASGQTVGILGGTGAGKTSLVQLIPRLYDVTGGQVLVGGHDVREYSTEVLRDQVAMVLQKNLLFSGTVRQNLLWGDPQATEEEMVRACTMAQADGFIRQMENGYDALLEQGGTNISGGQRQRLCIARALLKQPKILILDDSTSAVDMATDAQIRRVFREQLPQVTKLIIAQRTSSVEDADLIVVMDNGRIHAIGNHQQLLEKDEIYREVYESQRKGGDCDEA